MKLKLIDVKTEIYETQFGTCELCMSTGTAYEPTYIFEKENGERLSVEGYYWDWGDLITIDVENVIEFADFIRKQDFEDDISFDYGWLRNIVWDYEKIDE